MSLALPAHAKLNLSLRVLGRRPDGHHEIATRIQAISLHDLLIAQPAVVTSLSGGLPDDLVLRAAAALERAVGRALPTAFKLIKRVPAGAGLGGGSSDAAAALRALVRLHRLDGLSDGELAAVAAEVGSDVPFFLRGGAALARGRGERLGAARPASGWFALAWPGFGLSTARVYAGWDRTGGDGANHLLRPALALETRLAAFLAELGPGWSMTGSGSACFRRCADPISAAAAVGGLSCWTAISRAVGAWA